MKIVFIFLLILVGCNQNGGDNPEITEFPVEQIKDIDYLFAIDKLTVETLDSLVDIYPNSVYLHMMRLRYLDRIEDYDIYLENNMNINNTFFHLIDILEGQKKSEVYFNNSTLYPRHFQQANRSIKLDSHEVNIWSRLITVRGYLDNDEPIEAFNALTDVMSISDNPEVYYYSTLYHIRFGDIDDAKYYYDLIDTNYSYKKRMYLKETIDSLSNTKSYTSNQKK